MGHKVTLGGERLGSGNKNKVELHGYERSTHDMSYIMRTTMSPGTLVPFMNEVGLPADNWDIKLDMDIMTSPTVGPLFGSFKAEAHIFQLPVRLYQGKLHMNMVNIGLEMEQVKLPQINLAGKNPIEGDRLDLIHMNPSSIFSYLGIRGVGYNESGIVYYSERNFNGIDFLGYWDIYKQYFANKQEEIGMVIHTEPLNLETAELSVNTFQMIGWGEETIDIPDETTPSWQEINLADPNTTLVITLDNWLDTYDGKFQADRFSLVMKKPDSEGIETIPITQLFANTHITHATGGTNAVITSWGIVPEWYGSTEINNYIFDRSYRSGEPKEPELHSFPLENIDEMRMNLLTHVKNSSAYTLNQTAIAPYGMALGRQFQMGRLLWSAATENQEGLAIKTYQSDLFNNWISTEWIDGDNGINAITAIDTTGGSITIDEINLSKKIYLMLNRIAVSGGTYEDWQDATYDHQGIRKAESPIYLGGLIKELQFQEVISNAPSADGSQPIGTLAGRGVLGHKHKGGYIEARIDEHSVIMGIVCLTPRIDYSQGNKWSTNLKTMNDYFKPQLGEIGFQDLVTDQMAWFDTMITGGENGPVVFKSAGKQPAWINYMTNVNVVRGNFADESQQMFMTLNRRYEAGWNVDVKPSIKDLTTYIDPSKFNHIFADTRIDAQNFWVQIGIDAKARRKMSAKIMPNL